MVRDEQSIHVFEKFRNEEKKTRLKTWPHPLIYTAISLIITCFPL